MRPTSREWFRTIRQRRPPRPRLISQCGRSLNGLISGRYRNTIRGLWRVHTPGARGGNKWAPRIVYRRRFRGTRRIAPGRPSNECLYPKEDLMSKEQSKKFETASRRKFLTGAAAATAGAATL